MAESTATTACTIVARNYLPAAKVLATSYLNHHPGHGFVIAVIDAPREESTEGDGYRIVGPAAFGIAGDEYLRMATAYSVTELATAVKPYLLRELRQDHETVVFLDPDIEVFAPMPELAELAAAHGIVLAPHFLSPLPVDGLEPDDAVIMGTGMFNLGFIAVGPGSEDFLEFWAQRLKFNAIVAPEKQLFTDQRWVDQVPALFRHHVVTDPGYDVAYWNVHERPVERDENGVLTAAGVPLRFYHFSGYRPEQPWLLSYHCAQKPRVLLSEHPELRKLCDAYGAALKNAGYAESLEAIPYGFADFADGTPIPKLARQVFREGWIKADRKKRQPPPHAYDTDQGEAFRDWLASPADQAQTGAGLNRMTQAIWASRIDLQVAFPHPCGADADKFRFWCSGSGVREAGLPEWAQPAPRLAPKSPQDAFGVNLLGYLTAELGLGEMGRIVHEAIQAGDVDVASVLEEKAVSNRTGMDRPGTLGEPRFPISILAVNADQTRVILTNHPEVGHERYRIGLWAWELDDFPAWQHEAFGMVDEVWTVSDFCRTAIAAHSPVPVKTIPVPVRDPGEPSPPAREHGEPVRFLFAFDFNSVAERKNPWGTVTAFQRAFPGRDDVRLTIKAINGKLHPHKAERLRAAVAGDDRIELIERYLTVAELHDLYESSTCYVSLHRSEGFGLTVAEAMARAMPVISTDYSSTTEFLDASTGWPIPYRMIPVGKDSHPYHAEAQWADPDLDAAAAAMRQVADDPDEAARRGKAARAHILRTRSLTAAAVWMRRELEAAYQAWKTQQANPTAAPSANHAMAPMHRAAQALHWLPDAGAPARVPLAPAMRKLVLRAIDHYDVHQRRVMGELFNGVSDTIGSLLARIEALEAGAVDARDVADSGQKFGADLDSLTASVERLQLQAPGTELALRNLESDVARLSATVGAETESVRATRESAHEMFAARDQRLDQDEKAIQRVTRDVEAFRVAARLAHAPVPEGADVVPCDVGALLMPVDEVVLPWIVYHRSWEDGEAELMAELAGRAPGAFLDIGAHVGYHTLRLLRSCPGITRVIAVEADPVNAEFLRRNLAANLPPAAAALTTVVEAAAWDSEGEVRLAHPSPDNSGDNRVNADGPGTAVPAIRLDRLPEVSAQPVTLIKVDLQGRDHRALAGLTEILERDHPHVVCEFCPEAIAELGDDPADVLAGYRKFGYRLSVVDDDGSVAAFDRDDDEVIAEACGNDKKFVTLWLAPG
ncbi:MAG TPA: FkbM family methyltransferase, partial [Amycolatopsis sp.]|nr:FkbM family methyltransferase [Amycolatopsis sp.]